MTNMDKRKIRTLQKSHQNYINFLSEFDNLAINKQKKIINKLTDIESRSSVEIEHSNCNC